MKRGLFASSWDGVVLRFYWECLHGLPAPFSSSKVHWGSPGKKNWFYVPTWNLHGNIRWENYSSMERNTTHVPQDYNRCFNLEVTDCSSWRRAWSTVLHLFLSATHVDVSQCPCCFCRHCAKQFQRDIEMLQHRLGGTTDWRAEHEYCSKHHITSAIRAFNVSWFWTHNRMDLIYLLKTTDINTDQVNKKSFTELRKKNMCFKILQHKIILWG